MPKFTDGKKKDGEVCWLKQGHRAGQLKSSPESFTEWGQTANDRHSCMILLDSHLKAFLIKLRNSPSRVLLNTSLANKLFFPVCFWNIRLKHRNQFKLQTDHVKPLSGPKRLIQRRQWEPTPVLLPGKSHGQRSLVGCSPRGLKELDTTEQMHFHYSLSCIGEGNGNPLQCSCLENPRDCGAWWAAVYGVTQS